MKVADCLSNDQKQQNRLGYRKDKPPNDMTRKYWEELMGVNRDTYKRVRGKVKRR